jgi:N-hydroxyarylamine O-acetyltransferase
MRLHDYLERVGVRGPLRPDLGTLRRLHIAHREAFLFENLSIQTGGAISVRLEDIERKFLDEGRGGYCFEQNTLFAAALRAVGFEPTVFLGRVRRGPPERWCRTHMVLRVVVDQDAWLADVGFGGNGLLEPIPLRDSATSHQVGLTYMLRRDRGLWVLSCTGSEPAPDPSASADLYEFSDDAQTAGDVEVANHYTSTHPDSIFRRTLTIQRTTRAERTLLRHDTFRRYVDGRIEDRMIDSTGLRTIARDVFGIALPDGPLVHEVQAEGAIPEPA